MLRDNLVGLIVPMQSRRTQVLRDEFSYLENPRPVGAESSLTGRCSSPFQTEPRQLRIGMEPGLLNYSKEKCRGETEENPAIQCFQDAHHLPVGRQIETCMSVTRHGT